MPSRLSSEFAPIGFQLEGAAKARLLRKVSHGNRSMRSPTEQGAAPSAAVLVRIAVELTNGIAVASQLYPSTAREFGGRGAHKSIPCVPDRDEARHHSYSEHASSFSLHTCHSGKSPPRWAQPSS